MAKQVPDSIGSVRAMAKWEKFGINCHELCQMTEEHNSKQT